MRDPSTVHYPRSFLKLLLIGFAVVSMPLLVALGNAAFFVQRLATQSEIAVDQAAQSARGSRQLMEQVMSMERIVRQYAILGDNELLDDYEKVRADFKQTTSRLSLLPLDEGQLAELNRTIDREQGLYETLATRPEGPEARSGLVDGYTELSALARLVLDESTQLIDREIERMRATAAESQSDVVVQLAIAFALGLAIALVIAFLIARPIRQLDSAIRQLGAADFGSDIRVEGPADLRYLGERLEWLRRRLVELEEQKSVFLRHVSHELKTPLTALREGSELLADGTAGPLAPAQREIVGILRANSVQLAALIEDLLNYQRALASMSRLDLRSVDFADVVRKGVARHKLAADARGVRFMLDTEPAPVEADADKLAVVVDNLFSNAVKFSPPQGVVRVSVAAAGDRVLLDVLDDGPGIARADRQKVFDWFFQGERAHGGRVKGSGLGLAIARDLVLAHRGTISVVDSPAGAHLRVELPRSNA